MISRSESGVSQSDFSVSREVVRAGGGGWGGRANHFHTFNNVNDQYPQRPAAGGGVT